jgi:hypothetical protein
MNPSANATQFYDLETTSVMNVSVNSDIDANEFQTIQGAFFVILDNDANYKFSAGDVIIIYRSNDWDEIQDIENGSKIEIHYNKKKIGSVELI